MYKCIHSDNFSLYLKYASLPHIMGAEDTPGKGAPNASTIKVRLYV